MCVFVRTCVCFPTSVLAQKHAFSLTTDRKVRLGMERLIFQCALKWQFMVISEGDALWTVRTHSRMVSKTDFAADALYKDRSNENKTLASTGHLMK